MQPLPYHDKLLEEIQQTLGQNAVIPDNFQPLLQRVSESYGDYEEIQRVLENQVALRSEQLVASASNAYSFLDSLNMGLIICDVNPEVVLANDAVRRLFAARLADTSEPQPATAASFIWDLASIDALLQPALQLKALVSQSLTTNQPVECNEVNFGQFVLRLFIAPMVNEVSQGNKQQIGAVILIENITEQTVLERSKDEFLSIASHELRTPLTAIRGNSAIITKYYAASLTNPDMAEMINDIHESAVRLIEIVNDFLDASSLEQGKMNISPESFSLAPIVADVERELHGLCDAKGLVLTHDQGLEAAPNVFADKQRTRQVLYNLVGNAVKFTDSGSITIGVKAEDKQLYVTVTDTGRGMPPESQRLLFRKFQQAGSSLLTRDTTKGTGLGLYISKMIIEQSGGSLQLQSSEPGKGSVFVFSLPLADTAPAVAVAEPAALPTTP